jgi:hypothetical protein
MGVRGGQQEVLLDAHDNASQHPDQQNHDTDAHHERSDHRFASGSFVATEGGKAHAVFPPL